MSSLDLYAKIEPLIGFYEDYDRLYDEYIKILKSSGAKKVLDVGCGSGRFLERLKSEGFEGIGIDISEEMIRISINKGLNANLMNIYDLVDKFDAVVCIADVLNYMDKNELQSFLLKIKELLLKKAIFICDVNTSYGFEEVAEGSFIKDEADRVLCVDSVYDNAIFSTKINYFYKKNEFYVREEGLICQYYHSFKTIKEIISLRSIKYLPFLLFGDKPDKEIMVFEND